MSHHDRVETLNVQPQLHKICSDGYARDNAMSVVPRQWQLPARLFKLLSVPRYGLCRSDKSKSRGWEFQSELSDLPLDNILATSDI